MVRNIGVSGFQRRAWRVVGWVVALLCVFAPALALAQTLTGTFKGTDIGREVAFGHNGKPRNNWAGVLRLQIDNGPEVPVFCVQLDVRVRNGDRYRSDGPVLGLPNGCRIRYLLNAYPASTANNADEAAARQLAIWVFSDNLDPSTIEDAKVRDRTIALVTEAQGKPCPIDGTAAPDLAIDPPTAAAVAGQVVTYAIHTGPDHAGQAVAISIDGPAVVSDANGTNTGQQQHQLALDGQGNAALWVLGTGAGQSAIRASLPYQLDAGTVFSQIDDNRPTQRLVMAERKNLVANATAQAAWAAGAPSPAPATPPAQATPTSEATAPPAQATAVPEASSTPAQPIATPVPTRRPRQSRATSQPTVQPTAEQPTVEQPTVAPGQGAAATPITGPAAPNAAPSSPAGGTAQSPAVPQAPGAQAGAQQASGPAGAANQGTANQGAAAARPSSLPRTGGPASLPLGVLMVAVLALLGGWMLRRHAPL